jgi:hypothetical protein
LARRGPKLRLKANPSMETPQPKQVSPRSSQTGIAQSYALDLSGWIESTELHHSQNVQTLIRMLVGTLTIMTIVGPAHNAN